MTTGSELRERRRTTIDDRFAGHAGREVEDELVTLRRDEREARRRCAIERLLGGDERFDVILLDYRLPDSDDLALLANVRRLSPHTPVVLMSAFGAPEVVQGALDLGANRIVSKPFDMNEIVEILVEAYRTGVH